MSCDKGMTSAPQRPDTHHEVMGPASFAQPGRKRPPNPLHIGHQLSHTADVAAGLGEDRNTFGCCLEQLGRCCDRPSAELWPSATRYPALLNSFHFSSLHNLLLAG